MPRLGGSQECMERQSSQRKLLGAQGSDGAAVEEAKRIVQATMAHNGSTLLPGLGELLQQLLAARAAGALPVQNGSHSSGHGMALGLAGSLPNGYATSSVAAAAAPHGLASPRAEAQRSDRRRKEPAALEAGSTAGSRGPPPPPPCTLSPPMVQMAPSPPLPAGPQLCTASPQPLAAAPQVCASSPPPQRQPQQQQAAANQQQAPAPHHAHPASQLHADAKVFTPRSAAAAAATAADAAGSGSRGDAHTHEGSFALCHTARDTETGLRSPPPSPCSPVAAARPLSPVPAQQQGGHAASSAAYALVLQAAAAAAQTQFSCRSGGCGQTGGRAATHPTTGSSCGVPLKQDVHCSISMGADALMTEVRCGLTQMIMLDPVTAADGCNYERGAIEAWIAQQLRAGQVPRSPVTSQPLDHLTVCPNRTARVLIASLRAAGLVA